MVTQEKLGSMSGDEFWKLFVSDGSGEEAARAIELALSEQWRDVKKKKVEVSNDDEDTSEKTNTEIRIPDKDLGESCVIGIDPVTYELMIETSSGWRRSGQEIKTVLPVEEK